MRRKIRLYSFPATVPPKWQAEAIDAYEMYLVERDADIEAGREPSTDDVQPWTEFLAEYLYAELEHASS